ncbi:MAG: S-methyl-5'-thioadenosine phosphorylase [Anaerolineaceae bacterium]|nr:S-methyl-5'-thioadenosine phosphorylase [Anaerolineaceae bacterium]
MSEKVSIAVIGGSGLYKMPGLTDKVTHVIQTPFGSPSGEIIVGTLNGKRVAFLPRHGVGHTFSPSQVPYAANIYALKMLGVRFIISVSACGSLREDYKPGDLAIPDQIFDYTTGSRTRSFFEPGLVAHTGVADPYCNDLREHLIQATAQVGGTAHATGTFLIEEGPRFATKAESNIFRQWGCSIIGMTAAPEAFLAREAEIAYATLAHITDYDVWHVSEEAVTVDMVIAQAQRNLELIQKVVAAAVARIDETAVCSCHSALASALTTDKNAVPLKLKEKLKPIIGKYFNDEA